MTYLDELTVKRIVLKDKIERLSDRKKNLYIRQCQEQRRVLQSFFPSPLSTENLEISHNGVSCKTEDDSYGFFHLYVGDKWTADSREYTHIEINVPNFRTEVDPNSSNEWVVERFNLIAEYSKLVVDYQDDILAAFNKISERYDKLMNLFPAEGHGALRTELKSITNEIEEIKSKKTLDKLMTSWVKLNRPEGTSRFTSADLLAKHDWSVYNIKSLRVTRVTPSGKSVDLEIENNYYNRENGFLKINNVRRDNLDDFLGMYKEWIA